MAKPFAADLPRECGQPRCADAGFLPAARGRHLAGQDRRQARRNGIHLRAVRGSLPRLASALSRRGIGPGDTVAIIAPNVPAMLEAHYAVPGPGRGPERAQLPARCRDHRLLPRARRREGAHHGPRVLAPGGERRWTLAVRGRSWSISTTRSRPGASWLGETTYEALLEEGDPAFALAGPGMSGIR